MKIEEYMLSCPSKKFLGIECFGCGMQRSLVMVFQGKFEDAFHLFPAVYPLIFFGIFVLINFIDKKRSYQFPIVSLAIISAVVMIVSYFYRHFF